MSGDYYVYELINPITRLPFYIGITKEPALRHAQHCNPDDGRTMIKIYIKKMVRGGVVPEMNILYKMVSEAKARQIEKDLITEYERSYTLLNTRGAYKTGDNKGSIGYQSLKKIRKLLNSKCDLFIITLDGKSCRGFKNKMRWKNFGYLCVPMECGKEILVTDKKVSYAGEAGRPITGDDINIIYLERLKKGNKRVSVGGGWVL